MIAIYAVGSRKSLSNDHNRCCWMMTSFLQLAFRHHTMCSRLALEKAKRDNAAAKNDLEAYIIKTRGTFMDADKKLLKVRFALVRFVDGVVGGACGWG
eukprot:1146999-Pelagomonas_calceolata.AAC.7